MDSYFRPMRRKIGVFALVVICALTGLWVRGMTKLDLIVFPTGRQAWQEWAISDGIIRGWKMKAHKVPNEKMPASFRWTSLDSLDALFMNGNEPLWRWRENRFAIDRSSEEQWQFPCTIFIAIWWVVLPLTLLSGYLLISKSRAIEYTSICETKT